jgi:Flp pilus assembly protein TadB
MSGEVVHSLGMAGSATAGVIAVVLALVELRRGRSTAHRVRGVLGAPRPARVPGRRRGKARALMRDWGPAVVAGLGVGMVVGGPAGCLAGVVAGLGTRVWLVRRRRVDRARTEEESADPSELPLCADLMAACLAAGATPGEAAAAVGRCLGGPLGAALIRAGAELRLGGEPAECWDRFGRLPAARAMGRCLARASTTGTAPVAEMTRLAADYRAAQGRSALARARKAAVIATAPLGLCFLPAFLVVGVAPVVMGMAGAVLGGPMR